MPTVIDKPNLQFSDLTATANISFDAPFVLQGAAMTNFPQTVKGLTASSSTFFNIKKNNSDFSIPILSDNILAGDQETTLRSSVSGASLSYDFKFACFHKGLFDNTDVELSLVFLNGSVNLFHICVPLNLADDSVDENLFINAWIYQGSNKIRELPRGFTFNQILRVATSETRAKDKTKVAIFTDQNIVSSANTGVTRYTFCKFNDKVKINKKLLPDWWTQITNPEISVTEATNQYRPVRFERILQIMMPNLFNWTAVASGTPNITFNANGSRLVDYYYLDLKTLLGKSFGPPSKGKLENIKCYPIDLATQVNDDGSVNLDTTGLRALPVAKDVDMDKDKFKGLSAQQTNNAIFWIIVFGLAVICLIAIIAIVVVMFSGATRQKAMKQAVEQLTKETRSLRAGFPPVSTTPGT